MDILNKTIKKLSEEQYQELIMQVSGKKKNKPFMVLETARQGDVEDAEMMNLLQVNPSTYYTLKSRLNSKIASILSKKVSNPISVLMEEVARVTANLYGTNKEFSIRALKELEKQLIEYDLSGELIIVYKTLAQLHTYSDDYQYYDQLYNKHVAFSLAVSKAENLYYLFAKKIGLYLLSQDQADLEEVILIKREMKNICELYQSHRLFVIYNMMHIYYLCSVSHKREGLKVRELEIENMIKEMNIIFDKYPLDTFYQNIKCVSDFMFFEFYQKTQNQVRADFYLQKITPAVKDVATKHTMCFYVIQMLNSKIDKFLADGDAEKLAELNPHLEKYFDIDPKEEYHFISLKKFLAISRFYQKDYNGSAKTINELRNVISLKQYLFTDVECKLFQALQYCIMGEDGLCLQIISSLKRQIREDETSFTSTHLFIKLLKTALKPADYRKKIKKINDLWNDFTLANKSETPILKFLKLDENIIRRMTNPIKEN